MDIIHWIILAIIKRGRYREQDIMTVAACLIPAENKREPFWELSARLYLESHIAYVLECLLEEEHTPNCIFIGYVKKSL